MWHSPPTWKVKMVSYEHAWLDSLGYIAQKTRKRVIRHPRVCCGTVSHCTTWHSQSHSCRLCL